MQLNYHELLETQGIVEEIETALDRLEDTHPTIAIFGSARASEESENFQKAEALAYQLVRTGFTIMTGGGPGIMKAANKGARLANGKSIGLCINLLDSEPANEYIDSSYLLRFNHFFSRKAIFLRYARGIVCMPGGYGTLDELIEFLLMISNKKIPLIPIYLVGTEFWKGFMDWVRGYLGKQNLVSLPFIDMIQVTDSISDITENLCKLNNMSVYKEEMLV